MNLRVILGRLYGKSLCSTVPYNKYAILIISNPYLIGNGIFSIRSRGLHAVSHVKLNFLPYFLSSAISRELAAAFWGNERIRLGCSLDGGNSIYLAGGSLFWGRSYAGICAYCVLFFVKRYLTPVVKYQCILLG